MYSFSCWDIPFGSVLRLIFYATLIFVTWEILATILIVRKRPDIPLVGTRFSFTPRFILNLKYAWNIVAIAEEGYKKYPTRAFKIIRNSGPVIILPQTLLHELASLPPTIADSTAALERDLVGEHTGVDLILENRLHHYIVQRKLTARLPLLLSQMERAVTHAFDKYFPQSNEWVEFMPYKSLSYVSARLGAEVIVGPEFSDNPEWLHIAIEYTESLFKSVVVLRCFPTWLHPILCWLLPSYWVGWRLLRGAQKLLGPVIEKLLAANDAGEWEPQDDNPEDINILHWLCSLAKRNDRNGDTIGHVLVLVALATVHTTMLRMVNVLYDVIGAGPVLVNELLDELRAVEKSGWRAKGNPYDSLDKLDSVLRESQRMSPPTTLGLKRLFREPYTFQDGTRVEAGDYTCMAVFAVENDSERIAHPAEFDGLRAYRGRKEATTGTDRELLFSSPSADFLNFGYGKMACPGRFFASVVVKMIVAKALADYEFQFPPRTSRPGNLLIHEFLFTWPWNKMLVRRKAKPSCPF